MVIVTYFARFNKSVKPTLFPISFSSLRLKYFFRHTSESYVWFCDRRMQGRSYVLS